MRAVGLGVNLRERRRFYTSRTLREVAATVRATVLHRDVPDLAHLAYYDEITLGPIQRDEAILLFGLARMTRPRTVVEIGLNFGHSAYNLLRALDADARLYAFDVDPVCDQVAVRRFADEPRFVYRRRAQQDLTAADVDDREVDLAFVDGAHDLALNRQLFERLAPLLSERAVVAVHDTGTTPGRFIEEGRPERELPERWFGDEYEPQPDERAFVNWLLEAHPAFAQIHLHTTRVPRYGLTLLQRSAPLRRPLT